MIIKSVIIKKTDITLDQAEIEEAITNYLFTNSDTDIPCREQIEMKIVRANSVLKLNGATLEIHIEEKIHE